MNQFNKQFDDMVRRTESIVQGAFPIESKSYELRASNFRWSDVGASIMGDVGAQKEYKLKEKTLSATLKADLTIKKKGGPVVDRATGFSLLLLPHVTARASYIVDGNEVQTVNQLRLRPGPYTRFTTTDDTETFINAAGGGYRIIFSRQTGVLRIKSGTTFVYAYPILKGLGIADSQMEKAWGERVLAANKKYDDPRHLARLYKSMRRYAEAPEDHAELATMVDSFFRSKALDPEISNITMGEKYDRITPQVLLQASQKAVQLARGEIDIDDTESLAFKSIHSAEDFVPERLQKAIPGIQFVVSRKMERTPKISTIISPSTFTDPVKKWFLTSEFTRYSSQQNPIDMATTTQLTTTMGEGGIQSEFAVTDQLRVVHPSQMGFLDPLHSPEGSRIGVTGHLTIGVHKEGNRLFISVINAKTGEVEKKSSQDLANLTIAANDQFDTSRKPPRPRAREVKVKRGNDITMAPAREVDYIFLPPKSFFSAASDAIPFMHTNSPNRVLMADRHIEQAVPLVDPDTPVVQSRFKGEMGYDDFFGQNFNIQSPVDGTVASVSAQHIKIRDARGKVHTVSLHYNYPLNGGSFLTDTPIVKTGDKVTVGQVLSENNYTRRGSLALGKTLKTAFIPFKGQNFEDGTVISESAARKLTSEHQYNYRLEIGKNVHVGLRRWLAHFPDKALGVDRDKYDASGVIKKGAVVKKDEVLIPAVEQSTPHEEYDYAVLHKSLKAPWRDVSVVWDSDHQGEVVDVIKSARFIRVILKTHEPAQVGDKVSTRAGGKGIIVNIIPDNEMYRDQEGNVIDVLFNPACYDEATEILTVEGWKSFEETQIGELVVSKDPTTGAICEEPILNKVEHDYSGPMYRLKNKVLDLLVTPNHSMWSRKWKTGDWELKEAQDIFGERRFYDASGVWSKTEPKKITLFKDAVKEWSARPGFLQRGPKPKVVVVPYRDWVSFLAYFVTEGWTSKNEKSYKYQIGLCQSAIANPSVTIAIDSLLTRLPFNFLRTERDDGMVVWTTNHKALYDWLRKNCGTSSPEKRFPRSVLRESSCSTLSLILSILVATDGNVRWEPEGGHYNSQRYFSTSRILMDQVQEMALKTGFRANVRKHKGSRHNKHQMFVASISKKTSPRVNWSDRTKRAQVEKWEHYEGKVYCVEVRHHLLFVRRGGCAVWCGNSMIGRINPGQMFEGAAGKIAKKTGKKYLVDNFSRESAREKIEKDLAAHGISDTENVTDPTTSQVLKDIYVGDIHTMKLQHQVSKKFSARGMGKYTADAQPSKISGESAQNIGAGELYSLLAAGALHFLKDSSSLKSNYNPEYWRALQAGLPTPPPRTPFILDKFTTFMQGAGINLEQKGSELKALPMTDKDVDSRSLGEIKEPSVVRALDLRPEPGGLFDKSVTGGFGGVHWNHIDLETPIPNPLMEKPIISVTGLKPAEYKGIVSGNLFVTPEGELTADPEEGKPMGEGLKILLSKVDVNRDLRRAISDARGATGNNLNDLNKKRRYLSALKSMNMRPEEAYIQSKVAVVPAKFRPIYPLPDGSLNVADPNHSYREIILINNQLKDLKAQGIDNKNLARLRADLFAAVQGTVGVTEPLTRSKHFKGFISTIKGRSNKYGLFQGRVVKRPQDLSARSTIIPDPKLGIDEVGIPEEMAFTLYQPFLVRRLVNAGHKPADAMDMVKARDSLARDAMLEEAKERPLYLNRAPSLHRFSMIPFKPRIMAGKAININPLIVSGFNADFDGDHMLHYILTYISDSARFLLEQHFGEDYLEDRRVTARFEENVPGISDGDLYLFDLEDFPAGPHLFTKDGENGPIEWHTAIPGTKVLSYDEENGGVKWTDVEYFSVHPDREIFIVRLRSGREIITDDHPRAVYGVSGESMSPKRFRPYEALRKGVMVPRVRSIESEVLMSEDHPHVLTEDPRARAMKISVPLDFEYGYLLGAAAGDGWVSGNTRDGRSRQLSLANVDENVVEQFHKCVQHVMVGEISAPYSVDSKKSYGRSRRTTWSLSNLSDHVKERVGSGARNKHLPSFFINSPEAFRKGLFAGLMDTDGSISISRAKKNPQLMANFYSTSLRLVREVKILAMTLGIDSRITYSKTPAEEDGWILSFSNQGIIRWAGEGMALESKRDKISGFVEKGSSVSARYDLVPMPNSLARHVKKILGASRTATNEERSLYMVLRKVESCGRISRMMAKRCLNWFDEEILQHEHGSVWKRIVLDEAVSWDPVAEVEKTGIKETGYDLTVPGFETFVNIDGVVLSNTMGVHVPVSEGARREAMDQLPSKNLFSVRDETLVHLPSKETVLGIYMMTAPKGKSVQAKSLAEVLDKFNKKEIEVNTPVVVAGKTWTAGQVLVNDVFPQELRPGNIPIDKGTLYKALFALAKKYPKIAGTAIDQIKNYGNHYVTHLGYSIGIKDLQFDTSKRDTIMAEAAAKSKRLGFDIAHNQALQKLEDEVKKTKGNRIVEGAISSGAFGKSNEVTQMLATPVAVVDHRERIIPVPIKRGYAEGHDLMSYWSVIPGSRKGLMQKGLGTQDTGAFSKRLLNTTINETISIEDCKTTNGVALDITSRDALDRVIADGPYKGKLVDPNLVKTLKGRRIRMVKVRSPMYCQASTGICAKCFGLLQNGQFPPIGYHIGALAGQAISEPMTQLMLRSFHTGGAMGKKMVAFDRVADIFEMPENLAGKATLAQVSGVVEKIEAGAGGGWIVTIDGVEHFVPRERGLAARKGQRFLAGQKISETGVIKSQELLATTNNMDRVRHQMLDDLDTEFSQSGLRIKRKLFETAIKPMTDRAEVVDAGDGEQHQIYKGDVVSVNRLNEINREIKKRRGRPIEFKPTLLSLSVAPYHSGDFIGQLMFDRPHQTIIGAPGIQAKADLKKGHPVTQYAFGQVGGKKT